MFGAPVLMGSAINLYKDALLLEDFAVVNYLAISKALKASSAAAQQQLCSGLRETPF